MNVNAMDDALSEWPLQVEQVWVTAHIVAARALELIETMRETAQIDVDKLPTRVMGQHLMSAAEAEAWAFDAPLIANKHEGNKAMRHELREIAKPAGRGRPKGSTNKGKAE